MIDDQDRDGVPNNRDLCPDTPEGDLVDEDGCSLINDIDRDNVPDDRDLCPDTPSGEPVDEDGCSESQIDTDGDGMDDKWEKDNNLNPNDPSDADKDYELQVLKSQYQHLKYECHRTSDQGKP